MKTVLLMESSEIIRKKTIDILELTGYKVLTTDNGKQGVEITKNNHPDLIICDMLLPQLDGFGVFHLLSKNEDTASIPFILLADKESSNLRKCMELGADYYLLKPFDDLELINAVEIRLKKVESIKRGIGTPSNNIDAFTAEVRGIKEFEDLISDPRRINRLRKRQILYFEGNHSNSLYFVLNGKVKTYKTSEDGREYILGLHKEGDFVGYLNLLEDMEYTDSAMAIEDTDICIIPRKDFFSLLYNNRNMSVKFIRMLTASIVESKERLVRLAYNSVRKRVAESLLMLQRSYQAANCNVAENFSMPVSRDDLASITGASKETVIRTLSDFRDEGLIEIKGAIITIISSPKLKSIKN